MVEVMLRRKDKTGLNIEVGPKISALRKVYLSNETLRKANLASENVSEKYQTRKKFSL